MHSEGQRVRPRRLRAALAAAIVGAWLLPRAAPAGELVAVLNESNPVTEMSLQQLRLIYGAYKRSWSDGTAIELLLPASGSAAMQAMVARVFKRRSEEEVSQYYLDLVFQQKLPRAPQQPSTREGLARVRSERGAILVADRDEVGAASGLRLVPLRGL